AGRLFNAEVVSASGHRAYTGARRFVLRVVQQIERRRSKVERHVLVHAKTLLQRGIDLERAGPVRDVAAEISPSPIGGRREGRGIEPAIDGLVRRIDRNTWHKVRPLR